MTELERQSRSHALGELIALALPTVAQMASYTVMQFLDTWMLAAASHGVEDPTAVGNAGLFAFSVISFGWGTLTVVNTFASQNFGRKAYAECGRYLWQGVWFSVAFSVLIALSLPVYAPMLRTLGHEPSLVQREDVYLKIVLSFTLMKLVGTAFSQFLLAVNRPGLVLISTATGIGINALAAYVMVFGKLGVAPMNVRGTAWAQNIGVGVETACLVLFSCMPTIRRAFNVGDFKPRWQQLRALLVVGAPAGVQIVADVLAWSLFGMWVMAQFGTDAMAGNNFMMQYMKVSFMPAFGISAAVTALVGRYIGMNRHDIAEKRANLAFGICAAYMVSCGLVFFFGRHALISLFTDDPTVIRYGSTLLIFAAFYQFFDAVYIVYNGALRGAGDTFVPAVATAILNWSITVGLGFFVAKVFPNFGIAGPWSVATCYGIILGAFIFARFKRGAWRAIDLSRDSNVQNPSATLTAVTS